MYYLKRSTKKRGEDGISPVVGIMLMLVVTIIIAAVVSGYSGSITSGTSGKAPTATLEFHIKNGGLSSNSYFSMKVVGVSEPIPTKNLKIVTSWTTTNKTDRKTITGGATVNGSAIVYVPGDRSGSSGPFRVPTGYGNGVTKWGNDTYHPPEAGWGNFSLTSGTSTFDRPVEYNGNVTTTYKTTKVLDSTATCTEIDWDSSTITCTNGKVVSNSILQHYHSGTVECSGYTETPYGDGCDPEWAPENCHNLGTADCTWYTITNTPTTTDTRYTYPNPGHRTDPMQAILGPNWNNLRAGDTVSVRILDANSGKLITDKDVTVEG